MPETPRQPETTRATDEPRLPEAMARDVRTLFGASEASPAGGTQGFHAGHDAEIGDLARERLRRPARVVGGVGGSGSSYRLRVWAGALVAAAALTITAIVAWPTRPGPSPGMSGITGMDLASTRVRKVEMSAGVPLNATIAPTAGDVNGDGRVDVLDARALAVALRDEALERSRDEVKFRADVPADAGRGPAVGRVADADTDGRVDRRDVLAVLRVATAMTGPRADEAAEKRDDEAAESAARVAGQPAETSDTSGGREMARMAFGATIEPHAAAWFDVTIDPEGEPLGAYQVEVSAPAREGFTGRIIGVEGSAHPAYRAVPAFDGTALGRERLILAAFSLSEELPSVPTRVARFQVRYEPVEAPRVSPEEAMKAARRVETPRPGSRAAQPGVTGGPPPTPSAAPLPATPASVAGEAMPKEAGGGGGAATEGERPGIMVIAGDGKGRAVRATARVTPSEGPIR